MEITAVEVKSTADDDDLTSASDSFQVIGKWERGLGHGEGQLLGAALYTLHMAPSEDRN